MRTLLPQPIKKHLRVWWLVAGICLIATTSCRADVSVLVDANEDGSGTVTVEAVLDADAAKAVVDFDDPSSDLALADMTKAGWELSPTQETDSGGKQLVAQKRFGTPEQFAEIMDELNGTDGLFQDFDFDRSPSFARVEYQVTGKIDTSQGVNSFIDEELASTLGLDDEQLAELYKASPEQVGIKMSVTLPGDVTEGETNSAASVEGDDNTTVRWAVDLSDNKQTEVKASSETRKVTPLVLRGIAILAGFLAALLLFSQILRVLSPDRKKKQKKASNFKPAKSTKNSGVSHNGSSAAADDAPNGDNTNVTAVVLDCMGVLYQEADDINRLLIPFVRERGSILTNGEIWAMARKLSLGRITTMQFWKEVGLTEDANVLDAAYVQNHQLSSGVIKYMRSLRDSDIKVACVANGAVDWVRHLRTIHNLEGLINPWVVSSSVGVRKPDEPMLEAVRRLCGYPPENIRFIDDDVETLDEIAKLGFLTAWYTIDGTPQQARGHHIIRSFESEVAKNNPQQPSS